MTPARTITSDKAPCVLHETHSPVTIINELHHPIPQTWQEHKWGEVRLGPVPVCATGHNTFHEALRRVINHGEHMPRWCVGKTRHMVEFAVAWYRDSGLTVKAP